ncbi:MAG TPA: cation transporter [Acetobacteraceae bacterium]|nr:cation transporter [Acetobacteraceae bacterium]
MTKTANERRALTADVGLRRAMRTVALLNFGYFGIEFTVASIIGSVALFADSVDFLEDTAVNLLVLLALRWPPQRRALLGLALGALLLAPGIATLHTAWMKLGMPAAPPALPLSLTGLGALAVNLSCALLLSRWRAAAGSLTRAAFLSARNDAIANVAIIVAGLLTAVTVSPWPDLVVGLGILLLNLDATRAVWTAAHREYRGHRAA